MGSGAGKSAGQAVQRVRTPGARGAHAGTAVNYPRAGAADPEDRNGDEEPADPHGRAGLDRGPWREKGPELAPVRSRLPGAARARWIHPSPRLRAAAARANGPAVRGRARTDNADSGRGSLRDSTRSGQSPAAPPRARRDAHPARGATRRGICQAWNMKRAFMTLGVRSQPRY